ncbi:hypothetical protein HDU98_001175 [Podochytrium sp. JEL0797]|nr:hypothetical protein HDU98_001175 [Podochytrium sp. JEL0797]
MTRKTALPTSVVRDPQPPAKTQTAPLAQKPKPQTPKSTTQSASLLHPSKGKENHLTAMAGRTPPVLHAKSVYGKVLIQNAFGLKDAGSMNSSAKSRNGNAVPAQKIVNSHQPDLFAINMKMDDDDDMWYLQHLFGDSNSPVPLTKSTTMSNPPLPAKANKNIKAKRQPKPQPPCKKPKRMTEERNEIHFVNHLFDPEESAKKSSNPPLPVKSHKNIKAKPQPKPQSPWKIPKLTTEERNEIQHFVNHLFYPEVPPKVVKKHVYDLYKPPKIHFLCKVEKEDARRAVFEIWAAAKPGWGTSRHQNGSYPKGGRCQRKRRNRQAKKEARARKAARSSRALNIRRRLARA